MSTSKIRPFINKHMNDLGYTEHLENFDYEDIGSTKIEKTFQVEYNKISLDKQNSEVLDVDVDLTLRFFTKSYKNAPESMAKCLLTLESILARLIDPKNIMGNFKSVELNGFTPVPMGETNDNIIRGELDLFFKIVLCR